MDNAVGSWEGSLPEPRLFGERVEPDQVELDGITKGVHKVKLSSLLAAVLLLTVLAGVQLLSAQTVNIEIGQDFVSNDPDAITRSR